MQATQSVAATGTTKPDTTSGLESDEPLVKDVTAEILGEIRAEWREGFDSGLRVGGRRVLESQCVEQIVTELVLLRQVAAKLGEKADYWMQRSDQFELEATYWHGVVASFEPPVVAANPIAEDPSAGGSI